MAAHREREARQQTEWLGAAEERKLFAADTMAACMHWPPGYSLNSADWSTEAFDSFQRPMTPRSDRRTPAASDAAAQQVHSNRFPVKSEPEEEVGLFSAEVFPSRLHTWKSQGNALSERAPLQGAPHLHSPPAFQPSYHLPQRQGLFPQSRLQEQRQQQQQLPLYPAAAAAAAPGQKHQSILTSSLGGGGVKPLRGAEALGLVLEAFYISHFEVGFKKDIRSDKKINFLVFALSSATQGDQHRPGLSLRGRRGSRTGRLRSRAMQGSLTESYRGDRLIQTTASDPLKTPAAAAAEGLPTPSPKSFQQLLQQQRDALQQQFEGVDRLRAQLEELEGALRLLQLQRSGPQQQPCSLAAAAEQQPCSLAAAAEQQQEKLAASASLDVGEDDAESQCWSLDPRDYKHLPAELLDWIPPAGLPSVRRRPSHKHGAWGDIWRSVSSTAQGEYASGPQSLRAKVEVGKPQKSWGAGAESNKGVGGSRWRPWWLQLSTSIVILGASF
ncbi:hypothetical protein Emag_001719 [Eimeria magna]